MNFGAIRMMSSSGRKEENDAQQRLIPSLSPRVQLAIQVAAKPSFAAMFARLANEHARISRMTLPRCAFTVISPASFGDSRNSPADANDSKRQPARSRCRSNGLADARIRVEHERDGIAGDVPCRTCPADGYVRVCKCSSALLDRTRADFAPRLVAPNPCFDEAVKHHTAPGFRVAFRGSGRSTACEKCLRRVCSIETPFGRGRRTFFLS
jgi:hypothetical protein